LWWCWVCPSSFGLVINLIIPSLHHSSPKWVDCCVFSAAAAPTAFYPSWHLLCTSRLRAIMDASRRSPATSPV
jgi:hypothetical protein